MIQLPVPTINNSDIDVVIDGVTYTLSYKYNTRNQRLYLSLLSNEEPIISGLRLVENSLPIEPYSLPDFTNGQLYIFKSKEAINGVTLGNIGIDKDYWLVYLSEDEWAY